MNVVDKLFISIPDGTVKEFHHRGTRADHGVLEQIFKNNDYSIARLRRAGELILTYEKIVNSAKIPLIIDAGANIGASAFWFSIMYPHSHTVCFEPDSDNFEFLKLNTNGFNVELHQAAIGSVDGLVDLIDPGEGEWGYQTIPNQNGITKMISLDNVVNTKRILGCEPFIVKIDIEGGEDELFSANTDWIDAFPLLIIELHDWLLPSKKTSANFLRAISQRDRDFVYVGENIFSIRNSM